MNILKLRIFEIEFYYLHSHKIRIDKKKTQSQQKKIVEYFDYFFALICRNDMSLTTNRKIMHDPVS